MKCKYCGSTTKTFGPPMNAGKTGGTARLERCLDCRAIFRVERDIVKVDPVDKKDIMKRRQFTKKECHDKDAYNISCPFKSGWEGWWPLYCELYNKHLGDEQNERLQECIENEDPW